jgi:hypothetical protein
MSRKHAQSPRLNFIRNYVLFMNFSKLFAALRALFAIMRLRGGRPLSLSKERGERTTKGEGFRFPSPLDPSP